MASADVSASPVPEADGGSSGEFVLKKLFAEFVVVGERKLQLVCSQPLVRSVAVVVETTLTSLVCAVTNRSPWPASLPSFPPPQEYSLAKSLLRGEDAQFDQVPYLLDTH